MLIWTIIKKTAHWFWFDLTPTGKLVILGALAILAILIFILYQALTIRKLEKKVIQGEVNTRMVEVNVLTNQINNSLEQGNVLQQNSNRADIERGNISNRDSSTYNGSNAWRKLCARYPHDSRCRQ